MIIRFKFILWIFLSILFSTVAAAPVVVSGGPKLFFPEEIG